MCIEESVAEGSKETCKKLKCRKFWYSTRGISVTIPKILALSGVKHAKPYFKRANDPSWHLYSGTGIISENNNNLNV